MLKRIQSAISTAHAISLAIREAPDAISECVEFARGNAELRECPECRDFPEGPRTWRRAWKMLKNERRKWEEVRLEMSRQRDILSVGQEEAESSYRAASTERNELRAQITEARELLSGLSSGLGYGLGGDDESLPSMIGRVRSGIERNLSVLTASRNAGKAELSRISARLAETERALAEMNGMYDEQCKATIAARENIEGLYAETAKERDELKARVENQASEIATLRNRVTELVCGRGDFRAKLARYEAAERWHQVTAGEGELPPPIPVLWEHTEPDIKPRGCLRHSIQGNCGTYRWRYASSKDVPQ